MESKRFGLVKLIEQPCCNLLESGRETWITECSVAHSEPLSRMQLWETITYCITLEDFPTHRLVSREENEWATKCGRLCHKSCLVNHICIGILLEKLVPMIRSCPISLDVNYRAASHFILWALPLSIHWCPFPLCQLRLPVHNGPMCYSIISNNVPNRCSVPKGKHAGLSCELMTHNHLLLWYWLYMGEPMFLFYLQVANVL